VELGKPVLIVRLSENYVYKDRWLQLEKSILQLNFD